MITQEQCELFLVVFSVFAFMAGVTIGWAVTAIFFLRKSR